MQFFNVKCVKFDFAASDLSTVFIISPTIPATLVPNRTFSNRIATSIATILREKLLLLLTFIRFCYPYTFDTNLGDSFHKFLLLQTDRLLCIAMFLIQVELRSTHSSGSFPRVYNIKIYNFFHFCNKNKAKN